jgi:hypothetical protein
MSDQTKPPEAESCGNCRFAHQRDEDRVVCRRYPPFGDPMHLDGGARFPLVPLETWCGEWALGMPASRGGVIRSKLPPLLSLSAGRQSDACDGQRHRLSGEFQQA